MGALAIERMTDFAGSYPARGTFPIKANVRPFKGGMVGIDSAGRAMPGGLLAAGCLAILGKSSATYDNRTGSVLGGAAAACDVEVEYGVFGWDSATGGGDDIAADDVGKVCYAVDDQTVALTNGTDTRPIAGYISEVRDGQVFVHMGPQVVAQIVIAASEASQLDTAQVDIDALQADALTAYAIVSIPLVTFLDADGDPLLKWAADNAGTCGFNFTGSEAVSLRWNNGAAPVAVITQVSLPPDLDDTAAAQVEFLCSKVGATVGDATTITVGAFLLSVGDLHDFDSDAGGATNALVGNATSKTTALLSRTIAAADIPVGARLMTLVVTPTAGLLATDDFLIHECRLRYQRKLLTA